MNTTKYQPGRVIVSAYFASFPGYGVAIEQGAGRDGAAWFTVARLAPFLNGKYFPVRGHFSTEADARKAANELWTEDLAALQSRGRGATPDQRG